MCGIFGYAGTHPANSPVLLSAAAGAGRRGPHGVGCYVYHPGHGWKGRRALGKVDGQRGWLGRMRGQLVLGHTRLATCGSRNDRTQLQPQLTSGGDAVAHNGVIHNPGELDAGEGTDSQALARAYGRSRDRGLPPAEALETLARTADHRAWVIVVGDREGRLWAHRHHHPLYLHAVPAGVYVCSQPLDSGDALVPEGCAVPISPPPVE